MYRVCGQPAAGGLVTSEIQYISSMDTPAPTLKPRMFRIGTWNMCNNTGMLNCKKYILAPNNGSWSCMHTEVLVPSYAVLAKLSHSVSQESFWLLAAYSNISSANQSSHTSALAFYSRLLSSLTDFIVKEDAARLWSSCIAASNWNFVEHDRDRIPAQDPTYTEKHIRILFRDIKSLCLFTASAGPKLFPCGWTYQSHHASGISRS
jgi:hypothetical protein